MSLRPRINAIIIVSALLSAAPVCSPALTTTWDGSDSTDWSDANNWSDGVPGPGHDVVITNVGNDVLLTNSTALLGSLTMNGGTLTFSNWTTRLRATNVVIASGTITLPSAFADGGMSNRVWIVCSNDFTLNTNAVIDVYEKGFAPDSGPGTPNHNQCGGGYGGKGGRGKAGTTFAAGASYGSINAPVAPGSGNKTAAYGSCGGGGAVRIEATGTVTIHGSINADGGSHPSHSYNGGGSGGAIYITCGTFQGSTNGLLSVDGGNVHPSDISRAGGGGGGRIAIDYTALGTPHAARLSASPGWCWANALYDDNWGPAAEMGTVWLPDTGLLSATLTDHLFTDCRLFIDGFSSWAVDSLTISNCSLTFAESGFELTVTNDLLIGANGHLGIGTNSCISNSMLVCRNLSLTNGGQLSICSGRTNGIGVDYGALVSVSGDVTIGSESWIFPYSHESDGGSVLFRMTNLTIAANGGFNAHGRGYNSDEGPGQSVGGGGGGYGGRGGRGFWYLSRSGPAYGSTNAPLQPGSGGNFSDYAPNRGGGLVRVEAAGDVSIDGAIRAGGASPTHKYVGCGSGGGVYLTCTTFSGSTNGLLSADGGNHTVVSDTHGDGGGGGRIAVNYTNLGDPHVVRFSTSSGQGWSDFDPDNRWWFAADHGTVYLPDTNLLSEVLTDELFNNVRLVVDGFTSWTVDSLTVSNCSMSFDYTNFQLVVNGDLKIFNGGLGLRDLTCSGNIMLTNGGSLSAYNVACSGQLDMVDGSTLSIYSAMTNGISENYGALVDVDGDLSIASSSWICPYSHESDGGSPFFRMANLVIATTNAGFNANGRGYAFAQGPGKGISSGAYGGGGGYGGKGGRGSPASATGGNANGSTNVPLAPGSGSANSAYGDAYGGGVVWIQTEDSATVNGIITANGGTPEHKYGGGGAGGSILIDCQVFEGGSNSVICADGGTVLSTASGGGGGGGRIAVWRGIMTDIRGDLLNGLPVPRKVTVTNEPFATYAGTFSVTNGAGWESTPPNASESGSIVFLDLPPQQGTLFSIR